jgi:DNA invertase Pin-like site-specific DNA recombinase
MKETLPQAIALCRVSTKSQMLDGNLEPQEERIIRAAAILNVNITKWWKLAVSSRKGKNLERKDIIEMFDFCKSNKSVKYLIVDEVDRFMRSISEYYYWKVRFQNIGVQLRHANRPEADPTEDRTVFDELIDIYRAESSNNERIHKTPVKMMEKIRLGFYPSNPKTGYRTTDIPGLHEPDEPNWSAMRDTFKEMISGEITVTEGLRRVTERGLRTRNYGPKSVGGKTIDMFRWKELMTDPYYCGVVKMKDWPVINEDGQHVKMITKEEHLRLIELALNKHKRFIVDRNNPTFLMSNEINCFECLELNRPHPRLVGYKHNNGRNGKLLKFYNRYRCRECSRNIRQETLHSEIDVVLEQFKLNETELRDLKLRLKKLWRNYEKVLIQQSIQAERDLQRLKAKKGELVQALSSNPDLANDIKEQIAQIKQQIIEAEANAITSKSYDHDFNQFIDFSLDFINNSLSKWWSLDKAVMRKGKDLIFPAGFSVKEDQKVYPQEISPIYRYNMTQLNRKMNEIQFVEGPVGLEPTTPCLKGRCSNQLSYGPLT